MLEPLTTNKYTIKDSFTFAEELQSFDSKPVMASFDRVAMGSPLGPTLANVFLCYHEKNWLQNCSSEFKPVIYRRYVDSTFLLFRSKHHIDITSTSHHITFLNCQYKNIRFTSEIENENSISLLDSRDNSKLTASV